LTGTAKAVLPASVERARSKSKNKSTSTPAQKTAQSSRARKRWANVPAEDRQESMRNMAQMRWATTERGYADAEHYFKITELDEAAETYQQMRKIYEMAGKVLDSRFQDERQNEERCSNPNCPFEPGGKRFDRNTPWFMRIAKKDPLTGRLYNQFACSPQCMVAIGAPGTKQREAPTTDARSPHFVGMGAAKA
jgi:hypothetical protein